MELYLSPFVVFDSVHSMFFLLRAYDFGCRTQTLLIATQMLLKIGDVYVCVCVCIQESHTAYACIFVSTIPLVSNILKHAYFSPHDF